MEEKRYETHNNLKQKLQKQPEDFDILPQGFPRSPEQTLSHDKGRPDRILIILILVILALR